MTRAADISSGGRWFHQACIPGGLRRDDTLRIHGDTIREDLIGGLEELCMAQNARAAMGPAPRLRARRSATVPEQGRSSTGPEPASAPTPAAPGNQAASGAGAQPTMAAPVCVSTQDPSQPQSVAPTVLDSVDPDADAEMILPILSECVAQEGVAPLEPDWDHLEYLDDAEDVVPQTLWYQALCAARR